MTPATAFLAEVPATFIGVRHHSPACARLIKFQVESLRPAHVLVEGPADMNERIGELLLDHELPVAIFSSYRDGQRSHASWSPFCAYSPEWVALTTGRKVGASVRFIDLPAWHPALATRTNRYADAERRHTAALDRLCELFAVDNVDALWDHLFEIGSPEGIGERLESYFEVIRGEATAGEEDAQREDYMASWIRSAIADAGDRPVVVVTGGFHRPAVIRLSAAGASEVGWPEVPSFPEGAVGGSYVIPYSYRRLDAFDGYQSGMPSPQYYHQLWETDVSAAGDALVASVVTRLRKRKQRVSTSDLIAARSLASGLALLRGHPVPGRVDVLDGLLAALVTDPLDVRPPWTGRGRLRAGTDPVIVEMIAALSGERVGRLHPDTPLPPLLHDVDSELERFGIPEAGSLKLDLTVEAGLGASRVLHRLRVLDVPGYNRSRGPSIRSDPDLVEEWTIERVEMRLPRLIEAGAYGGTLVSAAGAALEERFLESRGDAKKIAGVLFDVALCGIEDLSERITADAPQLIAATANLADLGLLLDVALGLWRHDRIFGAAGSARLAPIISSGVRRALWLVEGIRGGAAPADPGRLYAIVAVRDAVLHAGSLLDTSREAVVAVFDRLAADPDVPPDTRGASFGFAWAMGKVGDVERAVRGAGNPKLLGDWLAGLFALAREEIMDLDGGAGVVKVIDEIVGGMTDRDFLVALPSLRQAFVFFPPREREAIAKAVLIVLGKTGSANVLLRASADPAVLAWALEVEQHADDVLRRESLVDMEGT
jgi:hypothetical protein